MRFIRLTVFKGSLPTIVNMDNVTEIRTHRDGSAAVYFCVTDAGSPDFTAVTESIEEIAKKIGGVK